MKIVMISEFPDDPSRIPGGVGGVSLNLARALALIPGVEIEVLAINSRGTERLAEFDRMRVHYLPHPCKYTMWRMLWAGPQQVKRKLATLQYDIIHVQGGCSLMAVINGPRVLTIHGIAERDAQFRGRLGLCKSLIIGLLQRYGRFKTPNIINISSYVQRELKGQLRGASWDIENPVGDMFFDVQRLSTPGRVLFGGRVCKLKNVLGLIEAFAVATADRADAQLRIAGNGHQSEYGQECMQKAQQLGVAEKVHFLGPLNITQMQEELSRAWCLALCSFQENAPLIIEECMAAGLPVVASRVGGIPDLVDEGRTGFLVDPQDVTDIARGLRRMLQADNYSALCAQARSDAETRFKASAVAAQTVEAYRQVIAAYHGKL